MSEFRYKIWQCGAGALSVTVNPLGYFLPQYKLSIVRPGSLIKLSGTVANGVATFALTDQQVAALRGSPTADQAPYLVFDLDAFKHPGATDGKWGWAMRLARGSVSLPVGLDDGTPVPLDSQGFARTSLRSFAAGKGVAKGFDFISLA